MMPKTERIQSANVGIGCCESPIEPTACSFHMIAHPIVRNFAHDMAAGTTIAALET
jgi:hypothetical protein